MLEKNNIYLGDCLNILPELIKQNFKFDCILTDLPYGKTQNKWDTIIPFDIMWSYLHQLVYDTTPIILFGQDKFTAKLMLSNEKEHRYNLIWNKELVTGFLNANRQPLRVHEDICIFYKKQCIYNPQKWTGENKSHSRGNKIKNDLDNKDGYNKNRNYGFANYVDNADIYKNEKFPTSIIKFKKDSTSKLLHPTQKPIELLEWLIKTYTNENDLVLDFTMCSGSTCVSCINTNRNYIGIEKEENYFNIAKERIEKLNDKNKENNMLSL